MTATGYALCLENVHKRFGRRMALNGLDLTAQKGSILGIVGSNGAGKTTALLIAAGLIKPTSGTVDILGTGPFDPVTHTGRVAVLPQDSDMPPHALVGDLLSFYAALQGIPSREVPRLIADVLAWVHLSDREDSPIRTLSHGMKRRVAIAQAFLGHPELVLLDEPMSGLDPREVVSIRDMLCRQRNKQTILVSSHNLHEVERICDRIAFIEKGVTIREDSMDTVTGQQEILSYVLQPCKLPVEDLHAALPGLIFEGSDDGTRLSCRYFSTKRHVEEVNRDILTCLLRRNIGIVEIRRGGGLENAYLNNPEKTDHG